MYQPLIKNAAPTNKSAQFEELRKELPEVPIVNTTPALQEAAADALQNGSLLYWPDDTHWNAEGVRVAAAQIQSEYLADFSQRSGIAKVKSVSQKRVR